MATYARTLRRGLPRRPGGDAWPPAGDAPVGDGVDAEVESRQSAGVDAVDPHFAAGETSPGSAPDVESRQSAGAGAADPHFDAGEMDAAAAAPAAPTLRRGLPRAPGGEPWPPASARPAASAAPAASTAAAPASGTPVTGAAPVSSSSATAPAAAPATTAAPLATSGGAVLRRGLPRTPGGDPWPPAGTIASRRVASSATVLESAAPTSPMASAAPAPTMPAAATVPAQAAGAPPAASAAPAGASAAPAATAATTPAPPAGPRPPLTAPRTVWPGRGAARRPAAPTEPERIGPFTKAQWAGAVLVGGAVLLILAGMAVAAVRFVLSLDAMQDFLTTYPGEYHLPEGAPVGFPAWVGWQHFFNAFLMVLIIRTGLQIRTEKRPAVFWTPRRDPKGKTSLTIWFHQSLDILWLVNGVVFVILLFVSGQWMRIIPTSWEVFPNALSAALQYVSLDWPTENGWVNYNALQQIAYFTTVFVAAPLAAVTGYRMSALWPKGNARLNKAYPIEWARTVHFPVMLYFVAFILVHVALVFATGALRNLNHMYAAQGSVDGVAYADNWTGFWMFFASLVVIAGAWVAARPLVLAPIARLFGTVSGR